MPERKTFGNILATLDGKRAVPGRNYPPDRAFMNPLATAVAPIPLEGAHPGAGNVPERGFSWDHDLPPSDVSAWEILAPAAAEPPRAPPSDDLAVIAVELGLAGVSTPEELHRARRAFMWRNHPDRSPEVPPELANRRVAIANMLFDRALEVLRRRSKIPHDAAV